VSLTDLSYLSQSQHWRRVSSVLSRRYIHKNNTLGLIVAQLSCLSTLRPTLNIFIAASVVQCSFSDFFGVIN